MGLGKTYSTKYLADSNNNTGAAGQVLISTSTGINWSDGTDIIGGPYLPLAGGTMNASANINMNSGTLSSVDSIDFGIGQLNGVSTSNLILKSLGDITYNVDSNDNGNSSHIFQESGSELMRIRYDGNVGIGVTNPSEKLEVKSIANSDSFVNINTTTDAYKSGIKLRQSNNYGFDIYYKDDGVAPSNRGLYFDRINNSSSTNSMFIDRTSGNVGIGTDSPDYKLDVEGSANNADIGIRINNSFDDNLATSNPNAVLFLNAASNNGYLRVHGAPANTAAKHQIDLGSTAASSFLTLSPGGSEKVRIDTDGNVGIGTTSPQQKLDVVGRVRASYDTSNYYEIGASSAGGFVVGKSGGVETVNIRTYGDSHFNGGNVGIGTTSPASKLEVAEETANTPAYITVDSLSWNSGITLKNGNGTWEIFNDYTGLGTTDALAFYNGGYHMVIDNTGNVGIGTTSNSAEDTNNGVPKLQVNTTTAVLGEFPLAARFTTASDAGDNSGVSVLINSGNDRGLMISAGRAVGNRTRATLNLVSFDGTELVDGLSLYMPNTGTTGNTTGTNVGIGTSTPNAKLDVQGTQGQLFSVTDDLSGDIFSVADISGVPIMNVNSNGTSYFDGKLGVGTDNPTAQLQIEAISGIKVGLQIDATGSTDGIEINTANSTANSGLIWKQGTSFLANFYSSSSNYGILEMNNVNTTNVKINSGGDSYFNGGNVGIGTVNPDYKLDVAGDIYISNGESLYLGNANSRISSNSSSDILYFPNRDHVFGSVMSGADVERMRITEAGDVGIGTTSPSEKLEVNGNIRLGNSPNLLWGSNNLTLKTASSSTIGVFSLAPNSDGTVYAPRFQMLNASQVVGVSIRTDANSYFNGGNVGIGTTSPQQLLHVYKSNAPAGIEIQGGLNTITAIGDVQAFIDFGTNDPSATGQIAGRIESLSENTNGAHNGLAFYTGQQSRTPYLQKAMQIRNTGAISFGSGSAAHGSSGQILKSNADASPTWVDASTVIGGPYLPLAGGTMTGNTDHNDNVYSKYGTADQLRIWNNGSNSYIFNYTSGNINIGNDAADKDIIFYADRGDGLEDVFFRLDGSETNGTSVLGVTLFPDKSQARFGNQGDLRIYHDGSNSYIQDTGTGTLNLQGSTQVIIGGTNGEVGVQYVENGGVGLRHNNVTKLTTESTGVLVTGDIQIDSSLLSNQENTDVDTGTETIANVVIATYTAAFFDFVIKNGTNVRSGTVYACHDGTNVEFTETSTNDLGDTSDVTLSVDISGGNMRLLATVTSDDWSVKSLIRAI